MTVRNSQFVNDASYSSYLYGIYLTSGTNINHQLNVNNCVFNNLGSAVYINSNTANADNNWWGHITGPSGEGDGQGAKVSTYVTYNPYMTNNPYLYDFDLNDDGIIDILDLILLLKRL